MSAHIVMGMGFGDEGKGVMTSFLTRHHKALWNVRYNGGPQAAHNVMTEKFIHHTFSQFGSGTLEGAKTFLSRRMLVNPISLVHEAIRLGPKTGRDPVDLLKGVVIDPRCPIVTPYHVFANKLRALKKNTGTCAKGVGELASDIFKGNSVLYAEQLSSKNLKNMLEVIRKCKLKELEEDSIPFPVTSGDTMMLHDEEYSEELAKSLYEIASHLNIPSNIMPYIHEVLKGEIVLEGAQGILLDEWHGFYPYNTWSNTTPEWAMEFLDEANYEGEREIIGVLRAYHTRHGPGPMIEGPHLGHLYHEHNDTNAYQGHFRYGVTDGQMIAYAADCARDHSGLDCLAITHMDVAKQRSVMPISSNYRGQDEERFYLEFDERRCLDDLKLLAEKLMGIHYDVETLSAEDICEFISDFAEAPIKYIGHGPETGSQYCI